MKIYAFKDVEICCVERLTMKLPVIEYEITRSSTVINYRQNPESEIVWAGTFSTRETPLLFIDKEVKISQNVYQ